MPIVLMLLEYRANRQQDGSDCSGEGWTTPVNNRSASRHSIHERRILRFRRVCILQPVVCMKAPPSDWRWCSECRTFPLPGDLCGTSKCRQQLTDCSDVASFAVFCNNSNGFYVWYTGDCCMIRCATYANLCNVGRIVLRSGFMGGKTSYGNVRGNMSGGECSGSRCCSPLRWTDVDWRVRDGYRPQPLQYQRQQQQQDKAETVGAEPRRHAAPHLAFTRDRLPGSST